MRCNRAVRSRRYRVTFFPTTPRCGCERRRPGKERVGTRREGKGGLPHSVPPVRVGPTLLARVQRQRRKGRRRRKGKGMQRGWWGEELYRCRDGGGVELRFLLKIHIGMKQIGTFGNGCTPLLKSFPMVPRRREGRKRGDTTTTTTTTIAHSPRYSGSIRVRGDCRPGTRGGGREREETWCRRRPTRTRGREGSERERRIVGIGIPPIQRGGGGGRHRGGGEGHREPITSIAGTAMERERMIVDPVPTGRRRREGRRRRPWRKRRRIEGIRHGRVLRPVATFPPFRYPWDSRVRGGRWRRRRNVIHVRVDTPLRGHVLHFSRMPQRGILFFFFFFDVVVVVFGIVPVVVAFVFHHVILDFAEILPYFCMPHGSRMKGR